MSETGTNGGGGVLQNAFSHIDEDRNLIYHNDDESVKFLNKNNVSLPYITIGNNEESKRYFELFDVNVNIDYWTYTNMFLMYSSFNESISSPTLGRISLRCHSTKGQLYANDTCINLTKQLKYSNFNETMFLLYKNNTTSGINIKLWCYIESSWTKLTFVSLHHYNNKNPYIKFYNSPKIYTSIPSGYSRINAKITANL